MTSELKRRAKLLEIADLNWYLDAYMRTAVRLNDEEKRPTGLNIERLQRRLEHLFEKIIAGFQEEKAREQAARAIEIAINHCITDHNLPKTCCLRLQDKIA